MNDSTMLRGTQIMETMYLISEIKNGIAKHQPKNGREPIYSDVNDWLRVGDMLPERCWAQNGGESDYERFARQFAGEVAA